MFIIDLLGAILIFALLLAGLLIVVCIPAFVAALIAWAVYQTDGAGAGGAVVAFIMTVIWIRGGFSSLDEALPENMLGGLIAMAIYGLAGGIVGGAIGRLIEEMISGAGPTRGGRG